MPFGSGLILGRHDVRYFRCPTCGFVQTEEPYWLGEAYSQAIASTDIGLVARNLGLAVRTKAIISMLFDARGRFLDYAGGYGLFVRLMRDSGFDFYRFERQCPNLFAGAADVSLAEAGSYELLTAFELLEHITSPLVDIEKMLGQAPSILFSTRLLPRGNPKPGEWWYYGLEDGQHVSFYSLQTLEWIARRFGLRLCTDGQALHLLTPKRIPNWAFDIVSRSPVAKLIMFGRKKSLLLDDYLKLTGKPLE